MIIGIPKEIKNGETRAGMLPVGVRMLVEAGHEVRIQRRLGEKIGIDDIEYCNAGADLFDKPSLVWEGADLIVKVKEPLPEEIDYIEKNQTIFTYLHLAPARGLVNVLLGKRVTAIDYGTVQLENGFMSLQAPMSDIAGTLAIDIGAQYLRLGQDHGGKGILLDEIMGVGGGKVVIIGAGVVGTAAARSALAKGARVDVFDIIYYKLFLLQECTRGRGVAKVHLITEEDSGELEEKVAQANLLIGATLIPGALAKYVVTKRMIKLMEPGSVVVDVSIDQGGCIETSCLTSHDNPVFRWRHGIVHYCVPNMPAMVGRTATKALTSATFPFVKEMAEKGIMRAIIENDALAKGVNLYGGCVTNKALAESQVRKFSPLLELI